MLSTNSAALFDSGVPKCTSNSVNFSIFVLRIDSDLILQNVVKYDHCPLVEFSDRLVSGDPCNSGFYWFVREDRWII